MSVTQDNLFLKESHEKCKELVGSSSGTPAALEVAISSTLNTPEVQVGDHINFYIHLTVSSY